MGRELDTGVASTEETSRRAQRQKGELRETLGRSRRSGWGPGTHVVRIGSLRAVLPSPFSSIPGARSGIPRGGGSPDAQAPAPGDRCGDPLLSRRLPQSDEHPPDRGRCARGRVAPPAPASAATGRQTDCRDDGHRRSMPPAAKKKAPAFHAGHARPLIPASPSAGPRTARRRPSSSAAPRDPHDRRPRGRRRRDLRRLLAAQELRRLEGRPRRRPHRVVATTALAPNRALHLVRVGDELILVGTAEQTSRRSASTRPRRRSWSRAAAWPRRCSTAGRFRRGSWASRDCARGRSGHDRSAAARRRVGSGISTTATRVDAGPDPRPADAAHGAARACSSRSPASRAS